MRSLMVADPAAINCRESHRARRSGSSSTIPRKSNGALTARPRRKFWKPWPPVWDVGSWSFRLPNGPLAPASNFQSYPPGSELRQSSCPGSTDMNGAVEKWHHTVPEAFGSLHVNMRSLFGRMRSYYLVMALGCFHQPAHGGQ